MGVFTPTLIILHSLDIPEQFTDESKQYQQINEQVTCILQVLTEKRQH